MIDKIENKLDGSKGKIQLIGSDNFDLMEDMEVTVDEGVTDEDVEEEYQEIDLSGAINGENTEVFWSEADLDDGVELEEDTTGGELVPGDSVLGEEDNVITNPPTGMLLIYMTILVGVISVFVFKKYSKRIDFGMKNKKGR